MGILASPQHKAARPPRRRTAGGVLNIGYSEDVSVDEAISIHNDFEAGFNYSIPEIGMKQSELSDIIEGIEKEFGDLKEYDYSRNQVSVFKKFINENIRIYVRGNSADVFGSFHTTSEDNNLKLWEIYNKNTEHSSDVMIFVHSYFMDRGALSEDIRVIKPEDLGYISESYYPYLDAGVMFDQFFTGNENILLLVGRPGRGKSKLSTLALKHAYENPDKLPYDKMKNDPTIDDQFITCGFVKSLDVLANDSFWRTLEKDPPDFCIIDDLDYMLTKRDAEVQGSDDVVKNSFLNQFLSFTDGVEKNKTKFIITTNQSYDDIDSALLRKGRLFDILELRQLDKSEALEIWKENSLPEEEFFDLFKTHEVLPAELGSEVDKRLNNRIETATKSYLKEKGVSKVQKALRTKKISL